MKPSTRCFENLINCFTILRRCIAKREQFFCYDMVLRSASLLRLKTVLPSPLLPPNAVDLKWTLLHSALAPRLLQMVVQRAALPRDVVQVVTPSRQQDVPELGACPKKNPMPHTQQMS